MRHVMGYDRDFAAQFFARTLHSLLDCPEFAYEPVAPEEVTYLSSKLSGTVVAPNKEGLGSPWFFEKYSELAQAVSSTRDRLLLQRAEQAANQLLILEGIVAQGTLQLARFCSGEKPDIRLASELYRHSARGEFHSEEERFVLRQMARNTPLWVKILGRLKGNDLIEMMWSRRSSLILLPGEA